jgi:hypothetical protein
MIKIKIKGSVEEKHIKDSGPDTYNRFHVAGQSGEGVQQMNTMEECGCGCGGDEDLHVAEYGESPTGNPDLNADGIYDPEELYYHFDLDGNGMVLPDEYKAHVDWHTKHPEILGQMAGDEYYELEEEELNEKKDRCYRLAKQKYDVFPSAYASGFIVRCRKGKVAKKKK